MYVLYYDVCTCAYRHATNDVQVLMPVLGNKSNHGVWPKVVSDDVLKHVYLLKNRVHVMSGQVKGKTLLPLPASAEFNRCLAAGDRYVSFRRFLVLLVVRIAQTRPSVCVCVCVFAQYAPPLDVAYRLA